MPRKVAFVTAGVRGIGLATTRTLFREGWSVAFTYFSSDTAARALEREASQFGVTAVGIRADLLLEADVAEALHVAEVHYGPPQAVVHNYGPFVFPRMPLADYSDTRWHKLLLGNYESFWWLARRVIPKMREQHFGRIVTLGSDGADTAAGWRYRAPYAAAKAALASLTRSIAAEERQHGITANMVCPGDLRKNRKEQLERLLTDRDDNDGDVAYPSLTPDLVGGDIARTISFLLRPDSSQVTGQILSITAGVDVRALDAERPLDENEK